jgi:hypothetical protein
MDNQQTFRESTFSVHEIESFFSSIEKSFARACWHVEMVYGNESGRVTHSEATEWFKRYFPSNENQFLFRLMETHCVQTMEIA